MSVYLLQPANLPCAVKMLKYMEVVRGLADAGGDWRSYDAAFRTLRGRCGWAWDSISWELWLKASQSQAGRRLAAGPPFKARAGPDLRPPVRASRSTGASCAAVTPVGTLTSAGSAVEPTLLSNALRPKPTGNPLAPSSHPQVPLVAPRLPVDSLHGTDDKLPPPVSLVALQHLLHGYNPTILHYLLHGFSSGFSVGCIGLPPQVNTAAVTNLKSASEFPEVIDLKLAKELRLGRVLGPFAVPLPLVIIGCHPLVSSQRKLLVNFE